MNLAELELFTDEEKKTSFDTALKVAKENNLDFFEVYKKTLQKIIENKNQEMNNLIADAKENDDDKKILIDSAVEEANRIYKEQKEYDMILEGAEVEAARINNLNMLIDGAMEQAQMLHESSQKNELIEKSDMELNKLVDYEKIKKVLFDEKQDILDQIYDISAKNGNIVSLNSFINDARNGVINNSEFFRKSDYNLTDSLDRSQLIECLIKLNEKSRERMYFDYMNIDDKKIDEERKKEISNYDNLINNYKESKDKWPIGPSSASMTIDQLLLNVGSNNGSGRSVDTYGNNYDNLYELAVRTMNSLDKNTSLYSERLYNDIIELMNKTKVKLETMSPQEFRDYKVKLMELSQEELELFQNDLNDKKNNYSQNNKTL